MYIDSNHASLRPAAIKSWLSPFDQSPFDPFDSPVRLPIKSWLSPFDSLTAQLLRLDESPPRTVDRRASGRLRIVVISDAAVGRNGVGTYYEDLVAQLRPLVEDIALLAPGDDAATEHQWFSVPMPGGRHQGTPSFETTLASTVASSL